MWSQVQGIIKGPESQHRKSVSQMGGSVQLL